MVKIRKSIYTSWQQRIAAPFFCSIFALIQIPIGFHFQFSIGQFVILSIGALATVFCIMATYFMDPGVVLPPTLDTRNISDDDIESGRLLDLTDDSFEETEYKGDQENNQAKPDIEENEVKVINGEECKWCVTCRHWRRHGVTHCSDCGFCIQDFDHHCGVMGNCIAYRNHRPFIMIFFFGSFSTMFLLVYGSIYADTLKKEGYTWSHFHWWATIGFLFFLAYESAILLFGFLGSLAMTCSGVTMKEMNKKTIGPEFSFSLIWTMISSIPKNLKAFWCHPIGKPARRYNHRLGLNIGYLPCQ